jgi:mannose-6-phosphate isomerase class I
LTFVCNNNPTKDYVYFGYIDSTWTYENPNLNIEFPLPRNWYFMNDNNKPQIKIGSDINNIKPFTADLRVKIENFKKNRADDIATLFIIEKIDSSSTFISTQFDSNSDNIIEFGLVYSDNSDFFYKLRLQFCQ